MIFKDPSKLNVGDLISDISIDRISRESLKAYAKASGDHNPIHIDKDLAQKFGLPDVIVHGMLVMSYLGKMLTNNFPQSALVNFSSQFVSMTNINDKLVCSGKITKKTTDISENVTYDFQLKVVNENGEKRISGKASIIIRGE
jgi:acyl dehydratase